MDYRDTATATADDFTRRKVTPGHTRYGSVGRNGHHHATWEVSFRGVVVGHIRPAASTGFVGSARFSPADWLYSATGVRSFSISRRWGSGRFPLQEELAAEFRYRSPIAARKAAAA